MEKINLITPEDRATFDRIDRDCLKMHVCPPPKTFINMKVHDANGNLTLDMDMPSRSWVRNAYNMLLHRFTSSTLGTTYGEGVTAIKTQLNGVLSNLTTYYSGSGGVKPTADAGSDAYGIIVGTGSDAESFEGYALSAKISNGTASGQLAYQICAAPTLAYDSGLKKWTATLSRIFNNNSGSDISVRELGIVYNCAASPFLFSRDLLSSPVTVSNAAQLTVTYTIEMTFPA